MAEQEVSARVAQFPEKLQFLFRRLMPDGITPIRFKVAHGGRGGAKSWNFVRALLMQSTQLPLRVLCAREIQTSIKESVHKLIADQISLLGMNYLFEVQQTTIKSTLGGEFFFEGLRHNISKIKSYEGIDIALLEEADKTSKSSLEVLEPTLRHGHCLPNSEIWIVFNPNLESDEVYQRFVLDCPDDAWVVKMGWQDNPWFPDVLRRSMERLKAKDFDAYLHVWEGHCQMLLAGAVYASEMRLARAEGRICHVPAMRNYPVDTIWDLGYSDETAIWFVQNVGFERHYVDFYHNSLQPLSHYIEVLQNKGYAYGTDWLPPDAKAKTLATKLSVQEQLKQIRQFVRIVPRLSLVDGINAARTIFPVSYFDEKRCADGLQALGRYRYEVLDDSTGRMSREPVHDEYSHAADAFRYSALAHGASRARKSRRDTEDHDERLARVLASDSIGRPFARSSNAIGWMRK